MYIYLTAFCLCFLKWKFLTVGAKAPFEFCLTKHLLPPGPTMLLWCQGKCSLGSSSFHCVSSMPHPQWHERCLAVADGRGRKPKQLEHLTRAVFHCREKKKVPLLLSCNITMVCHNAFPGYRVSHCLLAAGCCCSSVTFHREIQRACLLSVCVTVVNDFSCSWSHNYVIVVCEEQQTTDWADVSWIVIIVIIIWTQLHCQYPKATNELHNPRCTSKLLLREHSIFSDNILMNTCHLHHQTIIRNHF